MSVNIGVIRVGVKVNMLPSECEVEVDPRLPIGVDSADVHLAVEKIVAPTRT